MATVQLKKILFPTDFSRHANQALKYAAALASRFHAELHLLHVIVMYEDDPNNPDHRFPDLTDTAKQLHDLANIRLEEKAQGLASYPFRVVRETRRAMSAYQEIVSYAAEQSVDLIVIGTHGRSGLSHLLLGSVAEKVVRYAPCPVLTVGREALRRDTPEEPEKILIPVDFSVYSARALQFGVSVAETFNSRIFLLYVVEEPVYPAFYAGGSSTILEMMGNLGIRAKRAMSRFLKDNAPTERPVTKEIREGRPASEIVDYAEEIGADLIVMGTHGLSGWDRFLVGSTTERVIRKAGCPVLSVKVDEASAD